MWFCVRDFQPGVKSGSVVVVLSNMCVETASLVILMQLKCLCCRVGKIFGARVDELMNFLINFMRMAHVIKNPL